MGEVWAAEDARLHRRVALKLLPPEARGDDKRVARFRREAEALAALNHPNIVTVYSVEQADGLTFLVMELVEGTSLRERIPPEGLPLASLLDLACPIVEAIAAAHRRGIIHRDLKPANVMVTTDGRPKILDFGLARLRFPLPDADAATETANLTASGAVLGTPAYMAPEQLLGRAVDHRCDVFSLGVMLFEMAAGRRPFTGTTHAALASAILNQAPPSLARVRPDVTPGLARLIARCLAREPALRPSSGEEIAAELAALRGGPSSVTAPVPARSVAVLPLENLAHRGEEEDFFADGMTDALITDLARIPGLKVIARPSVMRFRGSRQPPAEIARELNVASLVSGAVLHAGDRIRVSAQLMEGESGRCLWAERYDRAFADVLALQDEIARTIAGAIDAALQPEPPQQAPRRVDAQVLLLDLRGRHLLAKRTEHAYRAALECFHRAIDRDPTYAPAYVSLADGFAMLSNYGMIASAEAHPRQLAAFERAVELGASEVDVHRLRAFVSWQYHPFDWQGALAEYDRALAEAPGSAILWQWSGSCLGVLGRFEEAREHLRRAAELDPLSLLIPALIGWATHYFAGEHAAAVPYYRQVLALDPDSVPALWFLGQALTELGEFDEALAAFERALHLSERMARLVGYYGYACGRAGRRDEARACLEELERRARRSYVPAYFPALVHAGLGDVPAAVDLLERSFAEHDTMLRDLKIDPPWKILHDDPRYRRLVETMRYP